MWTGASHIWYFNNTGRSSLHTKATSEKETILKSQVFHGLCTSFKKKREREISDFSWKGFSLPFLPFQERDSPLDVLDKSKLRTLAFASQYLHYTHFSKRMIVINNISVTSSHMWLFLQKKKFLQKSRWYQITFMSS